MTSRTLTPLGLGEVLQHELFPDIGDGPDSIGFVTRLIVATSLPHSKPEDSEFIRNGGLYDLCLLAPARLGFPGGIYPRLCTIWMATEAVRRRSPILSIGTSLSGFSHGGEESHRPMAPRGTLPMLREQLICLCNLTVSCIGEPSRSPNMNLPPAFSGGGVRLVKQYRFWWDDSAQSSDLPHFIELSGDFFQEILAQPIP